MARRQVNPTQVFDPKTFTHAVAVTGGTLIYVSGQVSYDSEGRVVGKGDIRAQSERVFESLGHCLAASGARFDDIIKLNAYMVNSSPEAVKAYREVRGRYLNPNRLPASTLVGIECLVHPDLLLEVEAVACVDVKPAGRKVAKKGRKAATKSARKIKS